jgi:hypothetical protein
VNTCWVGSVAFNRVLLAVLALVSASIVVFSGGVASAGSAKCTTTTSVTQSGVSARACFAVVDTDPPLRRIGRLVRRQAASLGEKHPSHVTVVVSTRHAATALTGSIVPGDEPIYFVQAQGTFRCDACDRPPLGPAPTNKFLTLGLATKTLAVLDLGVAPSAVNLHRLGHVYRVTSTFVPCKESDPGNFVGPNGTTFGPVPNAPSGGTTTAEDMAAMPDYIPVTCKSGTGIGGWIKKTDMLSSPTPLRPDLAQNAPAHSDPVYADDGTTVVGHMYPARGFVPLGTDPETVPTIPIESKGLDTPTTATK